MTLQSGQSLLHYRLVGKIGEGGMGVVWKALDTSLNREVAIKVLPEEVAAHPERLARFSREARLLASLNDPHIAAVYGLHEDGGMRFLAMELVPGEDLSTRLALGPMPLDETLMVARQLAAALAAAHECGVIHRDLKPANIRLDAAGKVKVLDFGLAKALADDPESPDRSNSLSPTLTVHATAAGVIMGTAAYMSPEQARGKPVSRTADIWAFGCVVFEMLTGSRAFAGETVTDIIAQVVTREPDWQALPAGTPPAVRRLLRRCLAKDPAARLQHAGDARLDLDEAASGPPADEEGAPAGSAEGSGAGRRAGVAPAWAAALAVTGLALGWVGARWLTPPAGPAAAAEAAVVRLQMPLDHSLDASGLPRRVVAISPDGHRIIYSGQEQGRSRLFLRTLDSDQIRAIPGSEGALTPFFSPDGRSVGFYASGKLKQVSLSGGSPLGLCDIAGLFYGGTWREDDTIIFSSSQSVGLQSVPARGGAVTEIPLRGDDEITGGLMWPELLPGGRAALVTLSEGPGLGTRNNIAVLDLESGRLKVLDRGSDARYLSGGRVLYAQGNDLLVAPFDQDTLEMTGAAVSLGMDTRALTNISGAVPGLAVSASGTMIYAGIELDIESDLVWVDRQGRVQVALHQSGVYARPVLSADQKRVVSWIRSSSTGLGDIFVLDLEGAPTVRITTDESSAYAVWSPDGESLYFVSAGRGTFQMYRKRADGGGQAEMVLESPYARLPLSFSPDGKTCLVYEVHPETQRDIWSWDIASGELKPLVVTPYNERAPQFSPDGRLFAYVSNESGRDEIYVRRFPDDGSLWVVSSEGGVEPLWSPDGRELFYRHGLSMMAVPIGQGDPIRAGRPVKLFDGVYGEDAFGNPNYDISADGQRFLMVAGQSSENTTLDVVLNWTSEVERLLESK